MQQNKILPVWQILGESTHEIARQLSEKFKVKTSHTGTLDPMAQGVVVILLDDARFKKYEYAGWEKEYMFTICFGVTTDTYDGLGLPVSLNFKYMPKKSELLNLLPAFVGSYTQQVPKYSAIKVNGKPLHEHARNNTLAEIIIPKRHGVIKDFVLTDYREMSLMSVVTKVIANVGRVSGDFRQDRILKSWSHPEQTTPHIYVAVATFKVVTTKGIYVRGLANDVCTALCADGFVPDLTRLRNGVFTAHNSKTLQNIL